MTSPSIRAEGLTKRFGPTLALDRLDLKIEGSKCVGFLGPNGAGKTTALKMFTDMIFPTAGEAFLNEVSVQKDRKRALAACGVLIETPEIYPSLTPTEALQMVGKLRGLSDAALADRIPGVLAEVKMGEWANKKVGKFSKGMKQRINIAAALLPDPEILLLDEPTTGLDPRGMAEVRDIIRGLKRGQRLIFMSSHLLAEVSDVCDEVALLNRGKLLFYDTISNVSTQFARGQRAIDVGFSRPIDDATLGTKLAQLTGIASWERMDPLRVRLKLSGGTDGSIERLFSEVAGLGVGAVRFQESASALEEVYMTQVERGD
ncbi:MAG: ABC transporter ATP-binding protein [Thermoplasmata archaeon]|nr:ABC transporter ATP-binding protein [Thermoplasmata archaeon]